MKNKAFSLVETLIVVAVLGLLAALVIPQFCKKTNPKMAGIMLRKEMVYEGYFSSKSGWRTNTIHRIYLVETNVYDVTPDFFRMCQSNMPVYHE